MTERTVYYEIKTVTSYVLERTVTLDGKAKSEQVGAFETQEMAEEFQKDLMVFES